MKAIIRENDKTGNLVADCLEPRYAKTSVGMLLSPADIKHFNLKPGMTIEYKSRPYEIIEVTSTNRIKK